MAVTRLLEKLRLSLRDRYTIEREIGRGVMSTVYLAREDTGRAVALKILRPEFAATVSAERFHREIAFLERMDHPGIIPVLDAGKADATLFFTTPFARDGSLRERIDRDGPLSLADADELLRQVASALDHAHQRGVIHRDLKPDNILFDGSRVLIADFGVARALASSGAERLSASGLIVGTPHYMSPEQAAGLEEVTPAADIYALGCITFEILTGELPFTGAVPQTVIARHVGETPPSLRVIRPEIPDAAERAVHHALAKQPDTRPPTATAFLAELRGQG